MRNRKSKGMFYKVNTQKKELGYNNTTLYNHAHAQSALYIYLQALTKNSRDHLETVVNSTFKTIKGEDGAAGATGETGPPGATGQQGVVGPAGNISISSTNALFSVQYNTRYLSSSWDNDDDTILSSGLLYTGLGGNSTIDSGYNNAYPASDSSYVGLNPISLPYKLLGIQWTKIENFSFDLSIEKYYYDKSDNLTLDSTSEDIHINGLYAYSNSGSVDILNNVKGVYDFSSSNVNYYNGEYMAVKISNIKNNGTETIHNYQSAQSLNLNLVLSGSDHSTLQLSSGRLDSIGTSNTGSLYVANVDTTEYMKKFTNITDVVISTGSTYSVAGDQIPDLYSGALDILTNTGNITISGVVNSYTGNLVTGLKYDENRIYYYPFKFGHTGDLFVKTFYYSGDLETTTYATNEDTGLFIFKLTESEGTYTKTKVAGIDDVNINSGGLIVKIHSAYTKFNPEIGEKYLLMTGYYDNTTESGNDIGFLIANTDISLPNA